MIWSCVRWAVRGAVSLLALLAWAGQAAGPDDHGLFGGGRPVRLADLPAGALRDSMAKLPTAARQRAEEILTATSFHAHDLSSLRASRDGSIYYACAFAEVGPDPKLPALTGTGRAPVPVATPPVYHSRPGATNVIFLDFNGHVISNTQWNADYGVAVWNCRAFDTDGDATTFSDTEQQYIFEVWQRVAEDYAPYQVDVTTEQPATWTRTTGHALITPGTDASGVACPHNGYGGIAFLTVFNSFSYSYNASSCYSPAWVLPMSGSSYSYTAEAASHELGHNLGLSHDGTTAGLEYYGGHGGSVSWGPIMGTGYGQNISQWSKGEYYNANQLQDDLAIIASRIPYRADDYGDTLPAASSLPVAGIQVATTGCVENTGDADVFSFSTGAGTVSLSARSFRCAHGTWGGNVDLVLRLLNSGGTVVASNNPAADTHATLSASVGAGLYYLEVRPTGVDTPLSSSPSGYTEYGSLGVYTITGQLVAAGTNLFVTAPNTAGSYATGQVLQVQWTSGLTNALRVALLKNGAPYLVLVTNTPNDGEYSWTVSALTPPATTYTVRVSDEWNAGRYDDCDQRFTIQRTAPLLLNEPFNSASLPVGWTTVGASASWTLSAGGYSAHPSAAHSSPYNAQLFAASASDHIVQLITPPFNLAGVTNATLVFWHAMAFWSPDQDTLRVLFRTNATAAWTTQAFYSTDTPSWTERTLLLPTGSTNCAVAFEGNAKYGYGVCIDDVLISAPAAAIPPESSDSDGDSLPDAWEAQSGLNPVALNPGTSDADLDGFTDYEEYVADTHPTNSASRLLPLVMLDQTGALCRVQLSPSSTGRWYELQYSTDLMGGAWFTNGQSQTGNGGSLLLTFTNIPPHAVLRGAVRLP